MHSIYSNLHQHHTAGVWKLNWLAHRAKCYQVSQRSSCRKESSSIQTDMCSIKMYKCSPNYAWHRSRSWKVQAVRPRLADVWSYSKTYCPHLQVLQGPNDNDKWQLLAVSLTRLNHPSPDFLTWPSRLFRTKPVFCKWRILWLIPSEYRARSVHNRQMSL